ncbi:MAG: peptidoglycan editing factor PgeF [Geobacteraceae bacterium]|nr:peptidoglycan editing factor PgeF [Geobacteraceae bacterium]
MEIIRKNNIHYLEPSHMAATNVAVMGFTTRHEGVSRAPYNSLNLGMNTFDSPHNVQGNRSLFARTFDSKIEKLVMVNQCHGTDILVIDEPNPDYAHFQKLQCDGIVTNQPGVMIAVGVADCLPLLLLDPVKNVVATLHAGWKGTAGNIAAKGVETLVKIFGSNESDILAALGPCIKSCCYEVDEPVHKAFTDSGLDWSRFTVENGAGKWRLDLAAANRGQLTAAGIREENIESAPHCVCCQHDWFFSYRRDEGETGRQAGFICLK